MEEAKHAFTQVWVLHVVIDIAASIAVGLRFYSRKLTKNPVKADDWVALLAMVLVWGDTICTVLEYQPYLRERPKKELPVTDQTKLILLSFISVIFTVTAEVVTRFSVIFLYYRLFSVKRWLHYSLIGVGVMSIIWLFIVVFSVAFQCKPVLANFDASVQGTCLNTQTGFYVSELINMFLDIALVLMPITIIWKLKLPRRERIALCGIFLTGGFVIITAILRLVKGYHPDGETSITSLSGLSLWAGLHLGFGVICCCLPNFSNMDNARSAVSPWEKRGRKKYRWWESPIENNTIAEEESLPSSSRTSSTALGPQSAIEDNMNFHCEREKLDCNLKNLGNLLSEDIKQRKVEDDATTQVDTVKFEYAEREISPGNTITFKIETSTSCELFIIHKGDLYRYWPDSKLWENDTTIINLSTIVKVKADTFRLLCGWLYTHYFDIEAPAKLLGNHDDSTGKYNVRAAYRLNTLVDLYFFTASFKIWKCQNAIMEELIDLGPQCVVPLMMLSDRIYENPGPRNILRNFLVENCAWYCIVEDMRFIALANEDFLDDFERASIRVEPLRREGRSMDLKGWNYFICSQEECDTFTV
ncbi:hypothetical protein BJ875DRAFT_511081 [Amylocarpus encephaloides]|uniref:Rhodopsin domain-containing protein n=1 Tax=Amylocarpus encephaloides TaxID=45428 RepID=A0A9P7YRV8_9HELO|nr:hypothetical protein BJ875DRAFT_511081 [Amylocarpus encephaloides]